MALVGMQIEVAEGPAVVALVDEEAEEEAEEDAELGVEGLPKRDNFL